MGTEMTSFEAERLMVGGGGRGNNRQRNLVGNRRRLAFHKRLSFPALIKSAQNRIAGFAAFEPPISRLGTIVGRMRECAQAQG